MEARKRTLISGLIVTKIPLYYQCCSINLLQRGDIHARDLVRSRLRAEERPPGVKSQKFKLSDGYSCEGSLPGEYKVELLQ